MRKIFCILLVVTLAALSYTTDQGQQPSTSLDKRPNILLIVTDDMGYTDIGAFGSEIPTPNLDALAHAGIRFTNFHTASWCQPTRVMMMTGNGGAGMVEELPRLPEGERNNRLYLEWATLPELLRDAGYQTFMTGKWDLGLEGEYRVSERGFDRSFALLTGGTSHFAESFWREDDTTYYEDDGRRLSLDQLPADFYSTEYYTSQMLEYIRTNYSDQPWFAYVAYTAPHWPLQVPEDWLDRHAGRYAEGYDQLRERRMEKASELGVIPEGALPDQFDPVAPAWSDLSTDLKWKFARAEEIYASMIEYMDTQIGRIVSYLDSSGELDNTVIVFMGDHGASAGEHGIGVARFPIENRMDNRLENFGRTNSFIDKGIGFAEAGSAPFRYYKGSAFEGGLRAAAFIRYPGLAGTGGTNSTLVSAMDLLPTFLEIAGREHPGASVFNGREIRDIRGESIWNELKTGTASDRSDYEIGFIRGAGGALIRGQYKVINQPPPDPATDSSTGVGGMTEWRLYDIVSDPSETRDLAAVHPALVDSMVDAWTLGWRSPRTD